MTSQRYVSEELTHFAGRGKSEEEQYQTLLAILRSGTLRGYGASLAGVPELAGSFELATDPLGTLTEHEMFKANVVCFCDIPVGDIGIHTKKYGRFGLAFLKAFLLPHGATPVFYVARDAIAQGKDRTSLGGLFDNEVSKLLDLLQTIRDMQSKRSAETAARDDQLLRDSLRIHSFLGFHVLSFLKFFDGGSSDLDPENFYMEREWRVLGTLNFQVADVHRVFIPPDFAERFRGDLPAYNGQLTFP